MIWERKRLGGVRKVPGGYQAVWRGGGSGRTKLFDTREKAAEYADAKAIAYYLKKCHGVYETEKAFIARPPRWAPRTAMVCSRSKKAYGKRKARDLARGWAFDFWLSSPPKAIAR